MDPPQEKAASLALFYRRLVYSFAATERTPE